MNKAKKLLKILDNPPRCLININKNNLKEEC